MKTFSAAIFVCLASASAFAGMTKTERRSEFEKALNVVLASAAPQIPAPTRWLWIKEYGDSKPNKGQAIEPVGAQPWRSALHEDQAVTGDRTLEGCQMRYGKPCALIAVNDEITAEGLLTSKDMPRLSYSGKYDPAQVPVIRLITRNRPEVQNYYSAMQPKAMAIHPWGKVFMSFGNATVKEAEETALAKCNNDQERNGKDGRCFLYASNNDVVLSKRRMSAE
jgi:hypothetical protein